MHEAELADGGRGQTKVLLQRECCGWNAAGGEDVVAAAGKVTAAGEVAVPGRHGHVQDVEGEKG